MKTSFLLRISIVTFLVVSSVAYSQNDENPRLVDPVDPQSLAKLDSQKAVQSQRIKEAQRRVLQARETMKRAKLTAKQAMDARMAGDTSKAKLLMKRAQHQQEQARKVRQALQEDVRRIKAKPTMPADTSKK